MGDSKAISFPNNPRDDERVDRIAKEAIDDDAVAGFVVLFVTHEDGLSFKFEVPSCPELTDQMIGALDRVRHRLIQYQEGER